MAALLLTAYAALGFRALPWLVERQLPRFVAEQLGRQASVQDVRFNPFTLRFQTGKLLLAEAGGEPLVSVDALDVQMQWRSIVERAWTFGEVRLDAPRATLLIGADGRFNVAELLDTVRRRWPPDPASDATPPRLQMGQLGIVQGQVRFHDRQAGYDNLLAPIEFTLNHLSTLPGATDTLRLSARTARGGRVEWRGQASLAPLAGHGELTLEGVSLPELAAYLKPYTHARTTAGRLSATLPYRFAYADGKWEAALAGGALALRNVALAREGQPDAFATLARLDVDDVQFAWPARDLTIASVRGAGGRLGAVRDAQGRLDLGSLLLAATKPADTPALAATSVRQPWTFAVREVVIDEIAVAAVDETVQPALRIAAGKLRTQLGLVGQLSGSALQLKFENASAALADLTVAQGEATPVKLAGAGFDGGTVDLAARNAHFTRVHARGAALQVLRDKQGRVNLAELLPRAGAAQPVQAASAQDPAWTASVQRLELSGIRAEVEDEGSGMKLHVADAAASVADASSDLARPVAFDARVELVEGGLLALRGKLVPASGGLDAELRVGQLALAPVQPLLRRYAKVKLTQGRLSAHGRITSGQGGPRDAGLRYLGSVEVAGLMLQDDDGDPVASWKNVRAERLGASFAPGLVDIPDLRVSGLDARLVIEEDRSFSAARLLVAAPAAEAPPPAGDGTAFAVRVRRVHVHDSRLDFADLSLRPQFAARIHELQGVVTGLSTEDGARSQIELDGRVDEYGSLRARGDLNLFAPAQDTDLKVVFKNVDMVPATPYSTKFAGYKVAEGRISLDLHYQLRDRRLQGANQIVIERLTLGERVDSPDALKLPLQLAIAILKDKDGRIDLALPVTGDLDDPQFSYGALIWKAIGAFLAKIVTAPFRALGALFGIEGESMEAIHFDPGSARLAPPEREKIRNVAELLAKKPGLVVSVPAQYGEAADAAALKERAVRAEVAARAGITVAPDEEPPPVDVGDRDVRKAVRELYTARFGEADLDRQKKAAETAVPAAAATGTAGGRAAKDMVPLWRRVGQLVQGEPQVPDPAGFYQALLRQLNEAQPLPAGAAAALGSRRAEGVVAALQEAGVEKTRVSAGAPEKLQGETGGSVPLKLELAAR